jgi:hypothetical protein
MRNLNQLTLALLLALVVTACRSGFDSPVRCTAVIARVENGDVFPKRYFLVTDGEKPTFRIHVRVIEPKRQFDHATLVLRGFGAYSPDLIGREGDTVMFGLTGQTRFEDELSFEQVTGYTIVLTGSANHFAEATPEQRPAAAPSPSSGAPPR